MYELLFKNYARHTNLSQEEKDAISQYFNYRKYRKHQYILQHGEVSRVETFVISGMARIYELDDAGQEHVIQFGPEDHWVGDILSFNSGSPSKYCIDCLEDTEVLQITKADQDRLYTKFPALDRVYRVMIQNAYVASLKRISSSMSEPAAKRYADFIARYPSIEQRVPNHQIASYLGITPQSLSRIRRQGAGVVRK